MIRYRIITVPSGKAHSDWRDTREEAEEDAIRLSMADRDDADPAKVHLDPLVEIQEANILSEQEIWACAIEVHRQHGERALAFCRERRDALLDAFDPEGFYTWKQIEERVEQLLLGGGSVQ